METDLGEYIVQLAGQRPVHIVTPAMHMSAADVGRLFSEKLGEPFSEEHQSLTAIARKHLRDEYLQADMGVSGGNFAAADTGTLVLVENEGNAGLSTAAPPVHVALVGIEKMLPRLEHLPVFLNMLARSGTGQKLTSYTHLIHGPTEGQHLYIILLDNGRTQRAGGPGGVEGVVVHPLRGVPERLPGLSPRRRLGLRLGLSRPDRLDPHAPSDRPEKGGRAALRLVAVRGVRRSLPGENRHPPSTGPSPPSRGQRALADEFGQRAADVDRFGPGRWAARSLQADDVGGADWGCDLCLFCPGIPASLGPGPAAAKCRSPVARRLGVGGKGEESGESRGKGNCRVGRAQRVPPLLRRGSDYGGTRCTRPTLL